MHRRGMTIAEVLGALICTALLTTTMSVAVMGGGHGQETAARSLKDGDQIRHIHHAMTIFASENEDRLPQPGLIDRLPIEIDGVVRDVPGRGEADPLQNTTASLYSMLVCMNYLAPEILISPIERNPHVQVDGDFDWDQYDPRVDRYWDPDFAADLTDEANTSYAHMVMYGKRLEKKWRAVSGSPHLGNRGPLAGEPDADSFTCGPHGHWAGFIAFADGHVEMLTDMRSKTLTIAGDPEPHPDNIFAMETGPAGDDAVISFTLEVQADGPLLQHD